MSTPRLDALAALRDGTEVSDVDLADADAEEVRDALGRGGPWTLRRCVLDELDLSGLDLSAAVLERCDLAGARLRSAVLDGVRVEGGSLAGADLSDADLTDADLTGVDLSRARLVGARLTDTTFRDCRMIGADLTGMRSLAVTFTVDGSSLALARLADAALRGWRLERVDLSDADLSGADLRDAVFTDCALRGTDLTHARLAGADLRGADLGEITPETPAVLRGAIVSTGQAADVCRALGLQVI
ncbi:pentapeptide repeat-containing protein [Actinomycetospora sp. NBRC 106375]|uniref:pentapeptide repeat-containing protein n=1 Tax=Actinomycetospora sp. NBRC 106375 TaxID=3032207 RepID=UPI002552A25B|nr:pentapeptide repeat-containing protein [Actinomycetospora sp. NBRC 106375]